MGDRPGPHRNYEAPPIPFDFLPEDIQAELRELPQDYGDPVAIKLCDQCGLPSVLFHDLLVWTGAMSGLGTAATVIPQRPAWVEQHERLKSPSPPKCWPDLRENRGQGALSGRPTYSSSGGRVWN